MVKTNSCDVQLIGKATVVMALTKKAVRKLKTKKFKIAFDLLTEQVGFPPEDITLILISRPWRQESVNMTIMPSISLKQHGR